MEKVMRSEARWCAPEGGGVVTPEVTTNSENRVPIRWKDRAFYRKHRRERPVAERESKTLLSVPVNM